MNIERKNKKGPEAGHLMKNSPQNQRIQHTIKQYVVDAFTDTVFKGNQAAVCVLDRWLPEQTMMDITTENNFSETAFLVKNGSMYGLRWFTPGGEIDLCGHATLAAAYVILQFMEDGCKSVGFQTKSGVLTVEQNRDLYEIDMPAYQMTPVPVTDIMEQAIGVRPKEAWMGRDLVCVLDNEKQVYNAEPTQTIISQADGLLFHITAPGTDYDCVTRTFAPKMGVPEDAVCGSGHCHVIPLWSEKLRRQELCALQASRRTGVLYCRMDGERVMIAGKACLYCSAELYIPQYP